MFGYGGSGDGGGYDPQQMATVARKMALGSASPGGPANVAPPSGGFSSSTPVQEGNGGMWGGGYGGAVPPPNSYAGPGMGVRGQLKRMFFANAQHANPMMWGALNQLGQEANKDWTQMYAQQAAPQFDRLNDYQSQAAGSLSRDLAGRGIDDSSALGAGLGTIATQGAQARSQLADQVQQQALQRSDALKSQYLSALSSLVMGHGRAAADNANQLAQESLLKQSMQGNAFSGVLGGLMGLGGTLLGGPLGGMLGQRIMGGGGGGMNPMDAAWNYGAIL